MDFSYQALKARQREIRDGFPESLGLRTHRALSWLNRAEPAEDADGRFIMMEHPDTHWGEACYPVV